jgi:hypothetical protein
MPGALQRAVSWRISHTTIETSVKGLISLVLSRVRVVHRLNEVTSSERQSCTVFLDLPRGGRSLLLV